MYLQSMLNQEQIWLVIIVWTLGIFLLKHLNGLISSIDACTIRFHVFLIPKFIRIGYNLILLKPPAGGVSFPS